MVFFLIVFLLSFTQASGTTLPDAPSAQQLFEKGLEAEERGNYEEALDIWLSAKTKMERPSLRVGRNYIRLVAEQGMENYYEAASAMYRWGLSGEDVTFQKEYVMAELDYLEPLLSEDRRKAWNELLEANDPTLLEKMSRWWKSLDPTPATPYNERLVEHWQRIAYAREHYTRGDGSVYGTDDRGVIYVRYGEPERLVQEHLVLHSAEIKRVAAFLEATSVAEAAISLHQNPYYELWIYPRPNGSMRYNQMYIFGETPSGPFSRVQTIEELIPSGAFTLSKRYEKVNLRRSNMGAGETTMSSALSGQSRSTSAKASPGMILQWLYYQKLSVEDHYYAQMWGQLERDWRNAQRVNDESGIKFIGPQSLQKHRHTVLVNLDKAPEESSTITKELGDIPLEVHQYRLLDENNRPIFATFLGSRPQQVFLEDLSINQDSMFAGLDDSAQVRTMVNSYELYHGIRVEGPDGQTLAGTRYQPTMQIDGSDMQTTSGSAFTVPFAGDSTQQIFYAELHNTHPRSAPAVETPFPNKLRGLGRERITPPQPLDPDPSRLQMGDLILGYGMSAEDSASTERLVPFVVANDRQIPEGEELALHVEVYHLQEGAGGIRDFSLDYEILPVNFLGWTQERRDQLSLSLNFEQTEARFTEDLSIKAAGLDPGRYVLRMQATDQVSGQEVNREIEFEVVEAEDTDQ